MNSLEFRAEVKKQLTLRGWKYRDLALHSGLSLSVVSRYMRGDYPNDLPRESIARALGMG